MTSLPSGTVTFLFTDIEGSTKLAQQHRNQWETLRGRHHAILQSAIDAQDGYVFQIIGDAFCAAFHTAGDALRAAVKSQMDLHAENWGDAPIKVRMGIHTGKAEIQENGEYRGYLAMSRIQRLMSAGHGGQVLISAATQELLLEDLPENVSLRDLGERPLKDLIRPEHIYQLVSANLPVDFPPLKTLDAYRHNLPVQVTSFIGREKEQAEVIELLVKNRLVTLTGAGGIGKTRLSIEAALAALSEFPDGVFFVALAPLTDPNLIARAVVQALGFVDVGNLPAEKQLLEGIGNKRMLLVLDNCEHLIEGVAALASDLLSTCPRIKIIATSRESLRIPGEWQYAVPTLGIMPEENMPFDLEAASKSPMLMLFAERARAVRSDFTLTKENLQPVTTICMKLDGLPLAIELIAARIRLMPPQALLDRLSGQFILTADGMRSTSERQKTLNNAIRWSYNLLSAEEQKLFAYLSVFSGGFTLEAAEALFSQTFTGKSISNLLASLLDKSLLQRALEREARLEARYTMLVTIQEFARERLLEIGEEMEARDRHLAYFLDRAEQVDAGLTGTARKVWLERLEVDNDNLRAALEWSLEEDLSGLEAGLRLAGALFEFWNHHGYYHEGHQWFERLFAQTRLTNARIAKPTRAKALYAHGTLLWSLADYQQTQAHAESSLALYQELEDERGIALALSLLGVTARAQRDYARAIPLLEQSLVISRRLGDKQGICSQLSDLAFISWRCGEYNRAERLFEEALAFSLELGDIKGMAEIKIGFITVAMAQGNYHQAYELCRENLSLFQELGDKPGIADTLSILGTLSWRQGDYAQAAELLEASLALQREMGALRSIARTLSALGAVALSQGHVEHARLLYEQVSTITEALSDKLDKSNVRQSLANVAFAEGNYITAEDLYEESLARFREINSNVGVAGSLLGLGNVQLIRGNVDAALGFYHECLRIYYELGNPHDIAATLERIATLATSKRQFARAAQLFAVAAQMREQTGAQLEPIASAGKRFERAAQLLGAGEAEIEARGNPFENIDLIELKRLTAVLREELGDARFEALAAEGRAMTMEQAIGCALDDSGD